MSAQNSQGIQTLLDAERDASKIVQKGAPPTLPLTFALPLRSLNHFLRASHLPSNSADSGSIAREYRTKRVREARDEAKKEIDEYRQNKESEFKKFESDHASGNKAAEDEANKEADSKITEIRGVGKKSQDAVVKELLKAIFGPQPVAPEKA
ncbi:vacuolar ATPase [Xylariales sp. AK1849]|nr:vacuolar ATPase [Xylariales sp. AK1849]